MQAISLFEQTGSVIRSGLKIRKRLFLSSMIIALTISKIIEHITKDTVKYGADCSIDKVKRHR